VETKQSAIALSTAEAEQRHLLRDLGYCKWKQPQFIRRVKFVSKLQIMIWFRLEKLSSLENSNSFTAVLN